MNVRFQRAGLNAVLGGVIAGCFVFYGAALLSYGWWELRQHWVLREPIRVGALALFPIGLYLGRRMPRFGLMVGVTMLVLVVSLTLLGFSDAWREPVSVLDWRAVSGNGSGSILVPALAITILTSAWRRASSSAA